MTKIFQSSGVRRRKGGKFPPPLPPHPRKGKKKGKEEKKKGKGGKKKEKGGKKKEKRRKEREKEKK